MNSCFDGHVIVKNIGNLSWDKTKHQPKERFKYFLRYNKYNSNYLIRSIFSYNKFKSKSNIIWSFLMKILLLNPRVALSSFSKSQIALSRNTAMIINTAPKCPNEFFHISALLKKSGFNDILALDPTIQKLSNIEIIEMVKDFNPDIILIPTEVWISARCNIPFTNHVKEILSTLKENGVKTKFVVSGPHGTIFPEKTLRETGADIAIQGEPEIVFLNIVKNFNDLKEVKGISFFRGNEFVRNPSQELPDMQQIMAADYSILPVEKYFSTNSGDLFQIVSTRGCVYSCNYCSSKILNKKYRERNLEDVFKEIEYLSKKGLKSFAFSDEIFTLNKTRTLKICDYLEKKFPNLTYIIQTRSEFLNDEIMDALKRSRCMWIGVGFESAAQEILDRANKHGKLESVEKAIALGKKYDIILHLFSISLLPGETTQTLQKTLNFFKKVKPVSISMASATPIPGTALWEEGIKEGTLKGDSYEEALEKTGLVGTNFTRKEVEQYNTKLPVEITFSATPKLIRHKLKIVFKDPKIILHYIKKIKEYVLIKLSGNETLQKT